MSQACLILYSVGILYFCLAVLCRRERQRTKMEWFFAVVLPLASVAGAVVYSFAPADSAYAYTYLPLWLAGLVGALDELRDTQYVDGGVTVLNICLAIAGTSIMFGPGLLVGGVWLNRVLL